MGKKFLILGGAGFIGSALARALVEGGADVTVLDDLSGGRIERLPGRSVRFVEGSVLDEDDLAGAFGQGPDVVVNMAASFANLRSVESPVGDLRTNAEGTLRSLRHASLGAVELYIHASSSCVYGGSEGLLDEEATPPRPYTPYAVSKLASEHYAMFFRRYHGLPVVVLRYFNCYGPGEEAGRHRGVVARFVDAALGGEPLVITGSGMETRQFLYVEDAVRATLMAARAGEAVHGRTVNVASGLDTSILDLARMVVEVTCSRSPIETTGARDWDVVAHRHASTARAGEIIGFAACVGLRDGLERTARWMREVRA
jgi:nucleoside-diphosphate-sugar epimerase